MPTERPMGYGASHQEIVCGPQVVEGAMEHLKKQQAGSSSASAGDICGCIPQGLGCSPQRQGHQRALRCPRAGPAYQCLGTKGNPPCPLAFPVEAAGPPCSCKDVAYVNKQGGMGSPLLCRIAHKLWTWAYMQFLSLRAMTYSSHG